MTTTTKPATWPDGTPKSQCNAFDWRRTPSGVDLRSLRAPINRTPKTPGGMAKNNGTIAGGLSPRSSGVHLSDSAGATAVRTATARAEQAPAKARSAKTPKLQPATQRHHAGAYSKAAAACPPPPNRRAPINRTPKTPSAKNGV